MKQIKKIIVALTSSSLLLLLVGEAGAAVFKIPRLQVRSERLYHSYQAVLTQDSGTFSPPPSGGTFSPPPSGETFSPPPSGSTFSPPPSGGTFSPPPGGDFGSHPPDSGTFGPPPGGQPSGPCAPGTPCGPQGQFGPPPGSQFGDQKGPNEICPPNTPCGPQGQFGPPPGGFGGNSGQFGPPSGGSQNGFGGEGQEQSKFRFMRPGGEGQFGGQGQNQQGGQGEQGFGGPSEEEMEKFQKQQDERILKDMRRGLGQAERGVKQMATQIAKMQKQGVAVPQELQDAITKLTNIFTIVKTAKTMDEVLAAGLEDMPELMELVNQGRQILEMSSRWGQTLKQVNQALTRIKNVLKKDQALAKRVKLDLSALVGAFETGVNELVAARDRASELAKAGDIEGAYQELESNLFDKMEDVMQYDQMIQTVSRLGKFESEFKRRYTQAQREINVLRRRKVDVTEMDALMAQIAEKGNEIKSLIKAVPLDQEAVFASLGELEDLVQSLEELMDQARGEKDELPWEKGGQQFNQVQLPDNISNLFVPNTSGQ